MIFDEHFLLQLRKDLDRLIERGAPPSRVNAARDDGTTRWPARQVNHGFVVGQGVYLSNVDGVWYPYDPTVVDPLLVLWGVVSQVRSDDRFVVTSIGLVRVPGSAFTPGTSLGFDSSGMLSDSVDYKPVKVFNADTLLVVANVTLPATTSYGITLPTSGSTGLIAETATSGTFDVIVDSLVYFCLIGAGGGGGRAAEVDVNSFYASDSSGGSPTSKIISARGGGGGGQGMYIAGAFFAAAGTSLSYTVGAKGAKAVGAGSNGSDGANSTLVWGAKTFTAYGGEGGHGASPGSYLTPSAGGIGGNYYRGSAGSENLVAFSSVPGANGTSGRTDRIKTGTSTIQGGPGGGSKALNTSLASKNGFGGHGESLSAGSGDNAHTDGCPGAVYLMAVAVAA